MICPYCGYAIMDPSAEVKLCSRPENQHRFIVNNDGTATAVVAVVVADAPIQVLPEPEEVEIVHHHEDKRGHKKG